MFTFIIIIVYTHYLAIKGLLVQITIVKLEKFNVKYMFVLSVIRFVIYGPLL